MTGPTVSISVIDAASYIPSLVALERTIKTLDPVVNLTEVNWFSDKAIPVDLGKPAKWTPIKRFVNYTINYGEVCLLNMPSVIDTDYTVIIHADGYAVNNSAWTDEFFEYDYIGAVWPQSQIPHVPFPLTVGNGGFCMRSSKLMRAIPSMVRWFEQNNFDWRPVAEDSLICIHAQQFLEREFGVKFAPPELANQWSIERLMSSSWLGKSLGFHGKHGVAEHYGVKL